MIGCLRTLYFESENELKFYNLEAWLLYFICVLISVLYLAVACVSLWPVFITFPGHTNVLSILKQSLRKCIMCCQYIIPFACTVVSFGFDLINTPEARIHNGLQME